MSTKRKKAPVRRGPAKRNRRKEESDVDSDISDASDTENTTQPDEVLIAGHGDALDEPTQLPQELLKTLIKPAGQLLIFGLINWDYTSNKVPKEVKIKLHPNLYSPHRFLTDKKVRLAVSGCVATHSVLITEDGKALTFGRNKFGQLGLDHTETKEIPTVVPALENMNVIGAACGRNHTLFLTDTGTVYACGDNRSGQCGVGNLQPNILTPTRINYRGPPIVKVGCGAEFSIILDIKGGLHSFGLPEYGQLGHNTDGKYFKTNTKLCFNFETSPKRIVLYIEKSKDGHVAPVDVTEIVDFSCGQNHTVAIDSKKRAFSWGFGGFGRLGHAEPRDELVPRLIKYFDTQSKGLRSIHCGSTYSLAVTEFGALFMFGQTKRTGEANMYPKPIQDLSGWTINHVAAGNTSIIVSADESVISWGSTPTFGELGLGEITKSSSTPKEVTKLTGVKVLGLSMGFGHTLLIAQNETPEEQTKLETFDVFEP
ncbi:protein RCC2 homolog [Tribolium madens]|uniref:protein RCC2 homolog n=1 Tax=Tribolium madens TaxID=41895 RepID=UPI001CF739E8|nr:protein RCC2 homolog [Tribolium madens]XP_044267024.1 protein RCC2 homolog [Tribolium madens]XP_044267025.1 protein RCC2 homolog [Tribolium madens]XP_044267026.1 protein RCC2 homolog [Tribolium madens]